MSWRKGDFTSNAIVSSGLEKEVAGGKSNFIPSRANRAGEIAPPRHCVSEVGCPIFCSSSFFIVVKE